MTLPRTVIASWLHEAGEDSSEAHDGRRVMVADLTVPELAKALRKAESTVRGWMPNVPGAYKLGGDSAGSATGAAIDRR